MIFVEFEVAVLDSQRAVLCVALVAPNLFSLYVTLFRLPPSNLPKSQEELTSAHSSSFEQAERLLLTSPVPDQLQCTLVSSGELIHTQTNSLRHLSLRNINIRSFTTSFNNAQTLAILPPHSSTLNMCRPIQVSCGSSTVIHQ